MTHSTLWLAQTQFFSALGFMLLFLVLEFGLAWVLLYFRIRAAGSNPAGWTAAYRFWVRVFALAFILSFAAGVPVLIQFGSLWPGLMGKIGDIAGPLLAAAILSTFIFKSCFLGAMLYGMRRLSDVVHTVVVAMVAIGVSLSTFFMLVLISWTHTPAGAALAGGQYIVHDAMQVVFNPALPWYGALFVTVSMLLTAFLMMGVVAGQASRNPISGVYHLVFRTALTLAVSGVVLYAIAVGGTVRMTTLYQPAKAAAIAGYWHSGSPPDLLMSGWPDVATESNRFAWVWRDRGAAWLGSDGMGGWQGLDQFSGMTPPVAFTFWCFRIAVVVGLLMALVAGITVLRLRRQHYDPGALSARWRTALKVMGASGGVLVLTTMAYVQIGSFPYAVYGTVTVSEVMAAIPYFTLLGTNALYSACYVALFVGFLQLLRYISRYGVIPVGRRRGRA